MRKISTVPTLSKRNFIFKTRPKFLGTFSDDKSVSEKSSPRSRMSYTDIIKIKEIKEIRKNNEDCIVTAFSHRAIDIIEDKRSKNSADLITIKESSTLSDAINKMLDYGVGCLFVEDEKGELVGIIFERTIFRKLALEKNSIANVKISDLMVRHPHFPVVEPGTTVAECLEHFLNAEVQYLPVKQGERYIGILSIGDIIRSLMDEYRETISTLQEFISKSHDYKY